MNSILYLIITFLLVAVALLYARLNKKIAQLCGEKEAIEGEERRLFDFLHGLGAALQQDSSSPSMHRYIVNGVIQVINADAGILYLLDRDGETLIPVYLSKQLASVIPLPDELIEKARGNDKSLRSYLSLATATTTSGLLGKSLNDEKTLFAANLIEHPDFEGTDNPFQKNLAVLVAPLVYGEKKIGILAITKQRCESPDDPGFTSNDIDVFTSIAEQSSFALGSALIHTQASEKRQLEQELRNASEIQRILLPRSTPGLKNYHLAATFSAAKMVSGDYYDYVAVDEHHTGVVIGDVCGKGIPAALIMAMCRSVLRSRTEGQFSPSSVLHALNRVIFPDIREDMFISLLYLILKDDSGEAIMARAGHDPPLLCHHDQDGEVETLSPNGIAAGIDMGDVFDRIVQDYRFTMHSGDVLLLYTDGVTETLDPDGDEFGTQRLSEVLRQSHSEGADAVIEKILAALTEFSGKAQQIDDITLIAVEKR
ncbi:MAG: SpoIIE family protein phosphatase [Verrucomicrobiales bacterium]|nr:SpoIIE family protein phosphatase [Verrucomicrobiales bacterium]